MRDSDVNLYTSNRLAAEFGKVVETDPEGVSVTETDLVGVHYRSTLTEMTRIVTHQWGRHIERSVLKGFLLHGGVGLGKTTLARRLAYELCQRFDNGGKPGVTQDEVVMILVDGADLARGLYGDTEEQLRQIFALARTPPGRGHHVHDGTPHTHDDSPARRTVLLFDDVESLFMHRASANAKEWHFSQNSVFFHQIDALDTGHIAVVLTTNRIDLLDEAIIDRFIPYAFDLPPVDVLEKAAHAKAKAQGMDEAQLSPVLERVRRGEVRSIRELERWVMRAYVSGIVGRPESMWTAEPANHSGEQNPRADRGVQRNSSVT
jgi:SpoVK/Ycf46/Vps4 family AAA+-type ATPase